ncbi:hypothetical protein PG996_012704 [Apiospora saccharicola]|uniref:2EXR domain-containing protein n=1 Tax=Apiospora saccharicola TaxID=335842 RepID=A0ABR1U655_9PEZI
MATGILDAPNSDPDMAEELHSFPKFTKLPKELRDMIWLAVFPQQLIFTRPTGYVWVPRPPAILQVNQESRNLMRRTGTPSTSSGRLLSHPVFEKNLFSVVKRVTLQQSSVSAFMKTALEMPSLKEVLVGMGEKGISIPEHTSFRTTSTWYQKVFGEAGWRLVHLSDGNAYDQIALLVEENVGFRFAQSLGEAHAEYTHGTNWSTLVADCEVEWLAAAYAKGGPGIRLDIDYEDPWVKKTIAGMPKLQPVFVMVDRNTHPLLVDNGSRVTRDKADKPGHIFNQEFMLWQKKTNKMVVKKESA